MTKRKVDLIKSFEASGARSRLVVHAVLESRKQGEESFRPFLRTWTAAEIPKMVPGLSPKKALDAIDEMRLVPSIGSKGYSLEQVNLIRDHVGMRVKRPVSEDTPVYGIMAGKGGTGKTTFTSYFAQNLCMQGLNVLLIDADTQGSASGLLLGVNPDVEFDQNNTLAPYFLGQSSSLSDVIIQTGMPGLSIIPCSHSAAIIEIMTPLHGEGVNVNNELHRLKHGIDEISSQYDVILIDTPPTINSTNLRCIYAASRIIHPFTPTELDLLSATCYENTLKDFISDLFTISKVPTPKLDSRKYVETRSKEQIAAYRDTMMLAEKCFDFYENGFDELTEISSALSNGTTVYEQNIAIRGKRTRDKAEYVLDKLFAELSTELFDGWNLKIPSGNPVNDSVAEPLREAMV